MTARRRRADAERIATAERVAIGLGQCPAEAADRVRAAIRAERDAAPDCPRCGGAGRVAEGDGADQFSYPCPECRP